MRHDVYSLPEVMFVAGQSNTLRWRLFTEQNVPFNAEGCTAILLLWTILTNITMNHWFQSLCHF